MERLAISVTEFCRATSIGRTKAFSMITTGEIKTVKVGSRRLILIHSVTDLLGSSLAAMGGSDAKV
jgi:hypothetical protein